MIKSSPYTVLVKAYPQPTSSLRPIVEKDISAFTTVSSSLHYSSDNAVNEYPEQ